MFLPIKLNESLLYKYSSIGFAMYSSCVEIKEFIFFILDEIFKHKSKIPINSFEGYVRQLFWREYQRLCYKYYNFKNKNYFGNKKKLTKDW